MLRNSTHVVLVNCILLSKGQYQSCVATPHAFLFLCRNVLESKIVCNSPVCRTDRSQCCVCGIFQFFTVQLREWTVYFKALCSGCSSRCRLSSPFFFCIYHLCSVTDNIVLTEKEMNDSFTSDLYTTDLTWRCMVSHLLLVLFFAVLQNVFLPKVCRQFWFPQSLLHAQPSLPLPISLQQSEIILNEGITRCLKIN